MCGIAGYVGPKLIDDQAIKNTLQLMRKRGPNNSGFFSDKINNTNKVLLHSRLSIIDLKDQSHQPFKDDNFIIVFNGEIYNYIELKIELQNKGYKFRTSSDTEVLLKSYIEYGEDCIKKFIGMWSLAIFDKTKNIVFLSRDTFGEKPLYYYHKNSEFIFGSEIKFIKSLKPINNNINLDKIAKFLNFGYKSVHQDNETFFDDIKSLEAGCSVTINSDLTLYKKKNYVPKFLPNKEISYEEIVNNTKNLIKKSLELRLRSDVPVAFCLSGGIDSAFLASLAVKEFNKKINTFSIIDSDERYNESTNINKVVNDLQCENFQIPLKNDENFLERLESLIVQHDSPIMTISYYIHSFLSEQISKSGFKVAISGTGADEIFTGYYDHYLSYFASVSNSEIKKKEIKNWKKFVLPHIRNDLLKNINLYIDNPKNCDLVFGLEDNLKNVIKKPLISTLKEKIFIKDDVLRNKMLNELFYQVVPVILHHDDLNSMNFSIENRSPYLDQNLLDFSLNIPSKYLIKNGFQKNILRDSAKGILLDDIRLSRQKYGFNASLLTLIDMATIKSFLINDKSYLSELVDFNKLFNYLDKNKNNSTGEINKFLFNLINIKIFLDKNF